MTDATGAPRVYRVGNPTEWEPFGRRNAEFIKRLDHLIGTLSNALQRKLKTGQLESVLFFTAHQAVDDFFEILLMCGNAEGTGAEKLLRSFFERVVLIRYLDQNPDKVDDYYDYYHVSMKKVLDSAIRFYGDGAFDKAAVAEAEANYNRVKEKFKGRRCKECGHTEMGIAWSSVPLPDMAQRVGLGRFIFLAYTMPLLNAHPTIKGTLGRLQGEEHGPIGIRDRKNPELADRVLSTAHALLILMLEVIVNRFPAEGLEEMFAQLDKDYSEIWKPKTPRAAT